MGTETEMTTSTALSDAIESRMTQLGIGPSELAERAGVSLPGLAPLRRGDRKNYQTRLTAPVEDALKWPHGTIHAILDGADPPPAITVLSVVDELAAIQASLHRLFALLESQTAALSDVSKSLDRMSRSNVPQRPGQPSPRNG